MNCTEKFKDKYQKISKKKSAFVLTNSKIKESLSEKHGFQSQNAENCTKKTEISLRICIFSQKTVKNGQILKKKVCCFAKCRGGPLTAVKGPPLEIC